MTTLIDRWGRDRPFLLAFVLMLAVVIPGFVATGYTIDQSRDAAATSKAAAVTAQEAADAAQAQADRTDAVIACVITWVRDNTDALIDRDVIYKTADAAWDEWLDTFLRLVNDRTPSPDAREQWLAASEDLKGTLGHLQDAEAIDPYPGIKRCLRKKAAAAAGHRSTGLPTFRLVANTTGRIVCFGRTPTIRGTGQGDVIHGTDKQDVIRAFGGDDIVHGGKGNDYICGGRGDDTLNGGQDYDRTRGNRGADFCIQAEKAYSC